MDNPEFKALARLNNFTLSGNKTLDLTIMGRDNECLTDDDITLIRAQVNVLALHAKRPNRICKPKSS